MPLCMTLIVAMPMESEKITEGIRSPFAPGDDVIDLYQIALGKDEFTPTTFSCLLLQELAFDATQKVVFAESLTPIDEISVVGASRSFDFDMPLDMRLRVIPQSGFPISE